MTLETRKIQLIDFVTENPYSISVLQAVSKFRLLTETVLQLIELLNLEIIGHKAKNKRREIEAYIRYNQDKTAKEVCDDMGADDQLVYSVAKEMDHRFQTIYSKKLKAYRK